MLAVCGSPWKTFSRRSLVILPCANVSPSFGSGTIAAFGAPLQQRKPRSAALLPGSSVCRAAQRCSGPGALGAAPRTNARAAPSLPGTSLATHSRRFPTKPSTSKPEAQLNGSLSQRASQLAPLSYGLLVGPLQARSHSSSVHSRSPRSAHERLASSRVTLVTGVLFGSFG